MTEKPYSQACENNKDPILNVIRKVYCKPLTVLEIGSGTGQHACHFAGALPHLIWQPTDRRENLPGIERWRLDAGLANLLPTASLDVTDEVWPCVPIEALFTANTLHIMHWSAVEVLFERLADSLLPDAPICIYGPFNYGGDFTSDSNARFDAWLKTRDPKSGVRDFEKVTALASAYGIEISADHAMPANNRLLVFGKR